ncbi:TPA: hypothetical protein ACJT8C_001417 [Legionella pneumophila]|nr:hypothetical protein [Legionella pneumophila]HDV6647524.1 hypothetical protein [Legionella pneumophila]HDV6735422.1 hypothetical protein [Legionella pneumophila]
MVTMLLPIGHKVPGINALANGLGRFHSGHACPKLPILFNPLRLKITGTRDSNPPPILISIKS